MSKKILFLNHVAGYGGAEIFLRDIAVHRANSAQQWHFAFFQDGPIRSELEGYGIPVTVVETGMILKLKRNSSLSDILRASCDIGRTIIKLGRLSRNFDLLCANSQKSLLVGGIICYFLRIPFVWIAHDIITGKSFSPIMRKQIVFSCNNFAATIVANSEATKVSLIESGVDPRKIVVVYNSFAVPHENSESAHNNSAMRIASAFNKQPIPLLGIFGRISPWKGHHVLIKALRYLPNVRAIVVGDTTYESTDYETYLRELVNSNGLNDRIKFMGFCRNVAELMQSVDIIVHTSVQPEPFGRVIVEGMLQRKPVVATRMGGVLEIIDDGINGVLVDPNDEIQLYQAIERLLSEPDRARRLADTGYASACRRFSLDTTISQIEGLFSTLLARKRVD